MGTTARMFADDGYVDMATGQCMNFMGDPVTVAVMMNLTDAANGGLVCAMSSSNTLYWNMELFGGNIFWSSTNESTSPLQPPVGEWCLMVVTQPVLFGGTPRWHRCTWPGGVASWAHQNASGTVAPTTAPGMTGKIRIGQWGQTTGERVNGLIEVAAVWNSGLNDSQVESLAVNFANWQSLAPLSGWRFNQPNTGTAVTDFVGGGANQSAIVGTSVGSGNPYFPDGVVAAPQPKGKFLGFFQ